MRSATIEPGLLRVFRWYVAVRLVVLVVVLWSNQQNPDPANPRIPEPGLFLFGILMLLLIVPQVQRMLGRTFLPIALILASLAPIVETSANIEIRLDAGLGVNDAMADFPLSFFLLFVPLLLISWQYRYRVVLVFVVATTVLDLGATISLIEGRNADVNAVSALITVRGLLYAFVGLFIVKLVGAQKEARRSLATHSATLEHLATSRERNRLARELHDTLAHSLSGIAVQLEAVRTLWDEDPDQAKTMLHQSLETARGGLGEARRAIQALRASSLEELGLSAALEKLGATAADRTGIEVDVRIADGMGGLAPELENVVYRIADESLTNVARHASASRAVVDLARRRGKIRLEVTDDGDGFDVSATRPDGHMGIKGMTERATMVGGTITLSSVVGSGTTVLFEVSPWK